MKNQWKKIICMLLVVAMAFTAGSFACVPAQAKITATCNSLFSATLKVSGNSSKLKYTSTSTDDFGALSASDAGKVKNIRYACDAKEVYSLCVIEAKKASDAKSLLKTIKKYKKNNTSNNYYLSDFTKTEQQVLKNAVCGKKGKYVWYIAMSSKKADNTRGQTAIKKKL